MVHLTGHIYAATADGKIVHIEDGKLRTLATFGSPPCGLYPCFRLYYVVLTFFNKCIYKLL